MNIFSILKCDENTDPVQVGNEYLRLSKCYEFILQESTDPEVRSIIGEKSDTVKSVKSQAPKPSPGVYQVEKGMQPAYLEAIEAFDSFSNIETFNAALSRMTNAYEEEPTSVINQYLCAAVNEVVKYLDANPDAM